MQTSGLHHVTAIASDPQQNLDFYTKTLGLRLIKLTVNFDAPDVYHFYYGDGTGNPGSILTFFPFPEARPARPGVGQTFATAFSVPAESIEYWRSHLTRHQVNFSEDLRFGDNVLRFQDADGLHLELVGDPRAALVTGSVWQNGPIPPEYAIRGFHGVTLWHSELEPTANLLTQYFGFQKIAEADDRTRYAVPGDALGRNVDIVIKRSALHGTGGAGSVHHLAWRTPDQAIQREWHDMLTNLGFNVTPVKNRQYFRSIYFREPGGVLFEIATDDPGFLVDENSETLGSHLKLPPWLEDNRAQIERVLTPVKLPSQVKE